MPTNREAYFEAVKLGVPKAVVDFVLKEVSGFDYLELTKRFDEELRNYNSFKQAINRYLNGEMIEYVFNKTYFLSLPFYVDKSVLIPRQETEQLVLKTKQLIEVMFGQRKLNIADVCCGSGAIGLSLKNELPQHSLYLSDISKEAIRVSKTNAKRLNLEAGVSFLEGDMLEPFLNSGAKLDVIVCNPPYIEDEKTIDKRTWEQEPHLALLASPDTKFYEYLLLKAKEVLNNRFLIAFEIGEDMEESLKVLLDKYCSECDFFFEKDMYGKTRFLFIKHQ